MSYQNALQQYFDGELDDVSEDMLFGELAHNHDARREFNEHTKLRAAMQKERTVITPPAHAAGAIFVALGYDLPSPVPVLKTPVAGGVAAKTGMFLKLLPYALTSLFSALVAVGIYAGLQEDSFKKESEIISNNEIQQANTRVAAQNSLKTNEFLKEKFAENSFKNISGTAHNQTLKGSFTNNFQRFSKNVFKESSDEKSLLPQIAVIANDELQNESFKKVSEIENSAESYLANVTFENPEFLKEDEHIIPQQISLEVRSIAARSFPENSVPAQSDVLKNTSISAFYQLSENHSIGVEAGREQFGQEYSKNINGETWKFRQNPLYWYGGAAYRFSLADTEFLGFKNTFIPFAQIFAGATQTGFLGKSQVGFKIVPERRVALVLAAEGSLLMYSVDGSWHNTGKLGLSYGVNVSF